MESESKWIDGLPKGVERFEKYYIIDTDNNLVSCEVKYQEDETGQAEVAIWRRNRIIGPADDLPQWFIDDVNK